MKFERIGLDIVLLRFVWINSIKQAIEKEQNACTRD